MEAGLNSRLITSSHIQICRNLNIYQANPFIKKIILSDIRVEKYERVTIFETYLFLGGKVEDFVNIFNTFNPSQDFDWYLLEKFSDLTSFKSNIARLVLENIDNQNVINMDPQREIFLLLKSGKIEGMTYLRDWFLSKVNFSKPNFDIEVFDNYTSSEAILLLFQMLEHSLLDKITGDIFSRPSEWVISILKAISLNSETAFNMIHENLSGIIERFNNSEKEFFLKRNLYLLEKEYYLQKNEFEDFSDILPTFRQYFPSRAS